MRVRIYDCDDSGNETLRGECDLYDCFPGEENDFDYTRALAELRRSGRVWVGGGAQPLTILFRADRG